MDLVDTFYVISAILRNIKRKLSRCYANEGVMSSDFGRELEYFLRSQFF